MDLDRCESVVAKLPSIFDSISGSLVNVFPTNFLPVARGEVGPVCYSLPVPKEFLPLNLVFVFISVSCRVEES